MHPVNAQRGRCPKCPFAGSLCKYRSSIFVQKIIWGEEFHFLQQRPSTAMMYTIHTLCCSCISTLRKENHNTKESILIISTESPRRLPGQEHKVHICHLVPIFTSLPTPHPPSHCRDMNHGQVVAGTAKTGKGFINRTFQLLCLSSSEIKTANKEILQSSCAKGTESNALKRTVLLQRTCLCTRPIRVAKEHDTLNFSRQKDPRGKRKMYGWKYTRIYAQSIGQKKQTQTSISTLPCNKQTDQQGTAHGVRKLWAREFKPAWELVTWKKIGQWANTGSASVFLSLSSTCKMPVYLAWESKRFKLSQ